MKYLLSFDVGTTSMKGIVFDENFNEIFYENTEYDIETDSPNIAELDADTYYEAFCKCILSLNEKMAIGKEISAVCFTTQGETLIPVDAEGNALTKAIVWLDSRADKEADFIKSKISLEDMYKSTGLYDFDGALPIAKVLWIYNNMRHTYDSTYKFLLLEDYLILRLTGEMVSEKSLQSSSGWYDIINDCLFDTMFEICPVSKDKFPEILPSGSVVGNIKEDVAEKLGLSPDAVVVTGAMDQISSAIGAGNVKEGVISETTGTALVVGATVSVPKFNLDAPLTIYKHYNDKFIYMPYSSTAGIVLKWFRDTVMPDVIKKAEERQTSSYKLIDEIAESSPAGSNGVIMNPDFTKGGFFYGLTLATKASDLARSVLEGVAYLLKDLVSAVEMQGVKVDEILSLGGGSYSSLWGEIKASVCNKKISCVGYSQTTALGAAMLSAVALGLYTSVEEATKAINTKSVEYQPKENDRAVYEECYLKYKETIKIGG